MRHGEAERFQFQDKTRSLTSRGEKQAITAGKWLSDYLGEGALVDIALVSSYVRAQQTYCQLSEQVVVSQKQVCEDVIPEGDPKIVHDFIKVLFEDRGHDVNSETATSVEQKIATINKIFYTGWRAFMAALSVPSSR